MGRGVLTLGRGASFWLLALILVLLLFAASAPSPVYREYQAAMGFSSLMLTAIYGSYAAGGIATLVTTGRLPTISGVVESSLSRSRSRPSRCCSSSPPPRFCCCSRPAS